MLRLEALGPHETTLVVDVTTPNPKHAHVPLAVERHGALRILRIWPEAIEETVKISGQLALDLTVVAIELRARRAALEGERCARRRSRSAPRRTRPGRGFRTDSRF